MIDRTALPVETIAVIGGGPAAMFFCHALELQRKEMIAKGQEVSHFPKVRCFERAPGPGGVWRSDRDHGESAQEEDTPQTEEVPKKTDDDWCCDDRKTKCPKVNNEASPRQVAQTRVSTKTSANMYSGLWTNGPKEHIEFFDYTFRDHFGNVQTPTHLPRKHILDYLLKRCTRNSPDFFEKYFSFRTTVTYVTKEDNKYRVSTRDEETGLEQVSFFDKCVWACGQNGTPKIPGAMVRLLQEGGFPGRIIHSTDTARFKEDVQGKNVLMVGGGLSAEDLALMAIKEGVSKIYCTLRSDDKEVMDVTRWPYDKVETLPETTLYRCSGSTIFVKECYFDVKKQKYQTEKTGETTILENIHTVIFCTGYHRTTQMLEPALREPVDRSELSTIDIPKDWTMEENDLVTQILGKGDSPIRPSKHKVYPDGETRAAYTQLYHGIFKINDPTMIYILESPEGEFPLAELDLSAWMAAKVVTKQIPLPHESLMREDLLKFHLEAMQNPTCRYRMDWKFSRAIDRAIEGEDGEGSMCKEVEELWDYYTEEVWKQTVFRAEGKLMNLYQYPVSYLESDGVTFSKYYETMMIAYDADSRDLARIKYEEETDSSERADELSPTRPGWRTFRDDPNLVKCTSYFTGLSSILLPKPWILLNEDDKLW